MNRVVESILTRIHDIDTRRALGLGPRKLSVDRYIDIPLEWDSIKYLPDSNSVIRYRNNGYISTHIVVHPVHKVSDGVYGTINSTCSSVYSYNYQTVKDEYTFYPGVLEGMLFSINLQ